MLHVDRPLPGYTFVDAFANINCNTRHNSGDCARPLALDWPMNMAAEQSRNLRVTVHKIGESRRFFRPAIAADIVITDVEGRMVNEQQRRLVRLFAQNRIEPLLAVRTKNALALARAGSPVTKQGSGK